MNPDILFGFAGGIATVVLAGGMTAALTLRKTLWRSNAWKDQVTRDEHGIDPLTGLYNREGFASAVQGLDPTSDYRLTVLAYHGLDRAAGTFGTLGAEHAIAGIGADLLEYAVDGLACRFEHPLFAVVTTVEDAERLAEQMQVAICSSTTKFENALWTGSQHVFAVFGETAGQADEIYGPAVHLDLNTASGAFDLADIMDSTLDTLAMEAVDELLEATLAATMKFD